jgi:nicotinamidase-related amidase
MGEKAVIVIDIQKCFLPGGGLPTGNARNTASGATALGTSVAKFINKVNPENVFITLDWHTEGHSSFVSNADRAAGKMSFPEAAGQGAYNKGMNVERYASRTFAGTRMWGDEQSRKIQKLWPKHCVQGTDDAAVADELMSALKPEIASKAVKIMKGDTADTDSYSAIADALGNPTPHDESGKSFLDLLKESNITEVHVTGIARDVCVFWTALDLLNYWIIPAYKEGKVIKLVFQYDLTRPVSNVPGAPYTDITVDQIKKEVADLVAKMLEKDVSMVSSDVEKLFAVEGDGTKYPSYNAAGGRRNKACTKRHRHGAACTGTRKSKNRKNSKSRSRRLDNLF